MNYFTWEKLRGPLKWVGGVGALAWAAGWATFNKNPSGFLQYADGNPCPSVLHSFSSIYLTIIGVAAAICLAVGVVCLIARDLPIFARIQKTFGASQSLVHSRS
jgi:hypothetical protein